MPRCGNPHVRVGRRETRMPEFLVDPAGYCFQAGVERAQDGQQWNGGGRSSPRGTADEDPQVQCCVCCVEGGRSSPQELIRCALVTSRWIVLATSDHVIGLRHWPKWPAPGQPHCAPRVLAHCCHTDPPSRPSRLTDATAATSSAWTSRATSRRALALHRRSAGISQPRWTPTRKCAIDPSCCFTCALSHNKANRVWWRAG